MDTAARLSLFAAAMAVAFAISFLAGRAFIPESTVNNWTEEAKVMKEHEDGEEK